MTKRLLLLAVVSIAMTACFGDSKKSATEVDTLADAQSIIAYTNNVTEYLNKTGDWLSGSEDDIEKCINAPRSKSRNNRFFISPIVIMDREKENLTKVPSSMNKEEQDFFRANVSDFLTRFDALREGMTQMKKYYTNEDYKDDDFTAGKALADSIENHAEILWEIRADLFDKIDIVTEAAERIVLEDHPLREPIFALKNDLDNFDKIIAGFEAYSEGSMTIEEVDALYKDFEMSVNKNKGAFKDILAEDQSDYDSFYKECEDALGNFRKILRNCKEGKKLTDRDLQNFHDDRDDLIEEYNDFM